MFGRDDNQQQSQDSNGMMQAAMPDPINTPMGDTTTPNPVFGTPPSAPAVPAAPDLSTPELSTTASPDPIVDQATQSTDQTGLSPIQDSSSVSTATDTSTPGSDDLMGLKQQALQHLSPLVSHLDQTPEEKFRTTMMMIQASDDQTLIKAAFEAAQLITDDKARAQALLDVINEINYFTQHQS